MTEEADWDKLYRRLINSEYHYFHTDLGVLLHGDCIEVMKTFPENSIDTIITDPPYGINISAQRKSSKFYKTRITNDANISIIKNFLPIAAKLARTIYMFVSWRNLGYIQPIFERYFEYKNCLVWDKMWFGIGNNWRPNHEFIMYGVRGWNGVIPANNKGNILRHRRVSPHELRHISEKPLSLLKELISQQGEPILDPFLGSGKTVIACELLNKQWIGIEIQEEFCEIAKERILGRDKLQRTLVEY